MKARIMTRTRAAEAVRRLFEVSRSGSELAGSMADLLVRVGIESWDLGFDAGEAFDPKSDSALLAKEKARADRAEADLNHLWAQIKDKRIKL